MELYPEILEPDEMPRINIDTSKPNIAVATKSPIEEEDFINDTVPKAQNADLINPLYLDTNIKVDNSIDSNSTTIIDSAGKVVDTLEKVNEASKEMAEVVKDTAEKVSELSQNNSNRTISTDINTANTTATTITSTSPSENKANVNIDADSVVVKNNVITDDEFFDDFFGDD